MVQRAFFGPARDAPVRGGLQVTIHLVPVRDGGLLAFDVSAQGAHGRWLPWAVLEFGQNPYEAASTLADDWCAVSLRDLALVDVMSIESEGGGWELAIVFRAVLAEMPAGDGERRPFLFALGAFDAIGAFDPVDLERWVRSASTSPGENAPAALHARVTALLF